MKRYKISTYLNEYEGPEFEAIESKNGEWVKWKDIKELLLTMKGYIEDTEDKLIADKDMPRFYYDLPSL